MGMDPRAPNDDEPRPSKRALHLLHLPQHGAVCLRRHNGSRIPLSVRVQGPQDGRAQSPTHLPLARHSRAPPRHRHHLVARLALWLRKPQAHRLRDVYPR